MTTTTETSPIEQASIANLDEDEMARWRRDLGRTVVEHKGRWWWAPRSGFYRPVHLLARLSADEATRPTSGCWGFHATLRDEDRARSNATLPTHRVADLGDFSEDGLSSNRRYQLRKARRLVELVHLTGPDLLLEQGWNVLADASGRTGYAMARSRERWEDDVRLSVRPDRRAVVAGIQDGRLVGWVEGYAVDGVAYLEDVVIATDALTTNVSTALQFDFTYAAQRSDGVNELVHGVRAPDDEKLTAYKERIGFPVAPVPAKVSMLPGAAPFIKWRAPASYYRLTGAA